MFEDLDTPIGEFRVAERDGRLYAAAFVDKWDGVAHRIEAWLGELDLCEGPTVAAANVRKYFDGDLSALDDVDVDMGGSGFQHAVWEQLRRITAGSTMSYSELASAIGFPRASRAVGTANGSNPVCLVVPCHRVIRADGTVGGYGGGIERKLWLLDHESIPAPSAEW
jgi:methylated-DNA-[protein]-cysteine S-methyltransferase